MRQRNFKTGAILCAALGVALALAPRATDWVIYNHSPSMPIGLYWRVGETPKQPLTKGEVVTIRAYDVAPSMAVARHFDGPHNRFVKHVAALPGDRVCAHGDALTVNDAAPITRRETLSGGANLSAPISIWSGCRVLREGEVLLLGETADSFDGRYWGPISTQLIEGVWRKL